MQGVTIRIATTDDVPQVAAMAKVWEEEGTTRGFRAETADELREQQTKCVFYVATRDAQVIGYAIGEIRQTANNEFVEGVLDDRPSYLEVQNIRVAAEHRNRGIGAAMMKALLDAAAEQGVTGSLVYSSNRDYIRTARFYEKLGYEMWHIHMTRK